MRIGRLISRTVIASVAVLALSGSASAGVLYSNPDPISSTPGNVDSWTLNFGYSVSDTFNLGSSSNLTSIDFLVWNFPGDHTTAIDYTISSLEGGGGTVFASGTGVAVTDVSSGTNSFGYDLNLDTFSLSTNLSAGTYWLTLDNAVVNGVSSANGGDPVYWDQGGGSSQAWESALGFLQTGDTCGDGTGLQTNGSCAETFRINGTNGRVPEPITLSIFGAGLAGAAAVRRRKAKSA